MTAHRDAPALAVNAPGSAPLAPSGETPTTVRYLVLTALGLAVCCAYLTRSLAAVNTTIQGEFGFTGQQMGYVLAWFFGGYFWFQLPGGWLVDRIGARLMLPAIALAWSLATLWICVASSGFEMYAARFLLGLAQAPIMPCCAKVFSDWTPDRERGLASAVIGVCMSVGAVAATGVTALLLPYLSWREILLIYAALGIVWAYAFFRWFRNNPAEQPSTNRAERELILAGNLDSAGKTQTTSAQAPKAAPSNDLIEPPIGDVSAVAMFVGMATSGGLWAVCLLAFFRAFGFEFFNAWFAAYLERGRGLLVVKSGLLTMAPLVAAGVGAVISGWLVDLLLKRTHNRWISRSGTAMMALLLCALCTLAAVWVTDANAAVAIISCGSFFFGVSGPAAWAATLDIGGTHKAVVFAIMNMVGNLGAFACQPTVGKLFDYIYAHHADWNLVLYLFFGINLAGALCAAVLNPCRSAVDHSLIPSSVD